MNRIFSLLLVTLCLCACNKDQSATQPAESSEDPKVELTDAGNKDAGNKEIKWMMLVSQPDPQQQAIFVVPFFLLDIESGVEAGRRITVADQVPLFSEAKLDVQEAGADSIEMDFVFPSGFKMYTQFVKSDKIYRGNIMLQGSMFFALLQPTTMKSLSDYGEPKTMPNLDELERALNSDDPLADMKKFISAHPDSSLNFAAYDRMIDMADEFKLDKKAIEEINQDRFKLAESWGSRSLNSSYLQSATQLIQERKLPDLAIRYLEQAKDNLPKAFSDENMLQANEQAITSMLEKAERVVLYNQLAGETEAQAKAAEGKLQKILEEKPYDANARYELAKYNARQKQYEQALNLIAPVSAVPFLEREVLVALHEANIINLKEEEAQHFIQQEAKKIWKSLNEKETGFKEFLNESYSEWTKHLKPDHEPKQIEKEEQPKVILSELFTGSTCGPCVAADLATGVLESVYDHSEVIVLRYHVHNPGKDPIANADSEARFQFYPPSKIPARDGTTTESYATPTLFLSGRRIDRAGGFLEQVPDLYERLHTAVDEMRGQGSPLAIHLKADARAGKLQLQAEVTGLPDKQSNQDQVAYTAEDVRLRLALVEKELYFMASNGIRKHEMIVREMPGGADGIAVKDGKLTFNETKDLAEFKQSILNYLLGIESDVNRQRLDLGAAPTFEFEEKPLDLKELYLVGFVQNDKTREILQAAIVPVSGEITYPKMETTESKQDNTPEAKPEESEPGKTSEGKTSDKQDAAKPEAKKPAPQENQEARPEAKSPPAEKEEANKAEPAGPALVPPKK